MRIATAVIAIPALLVPSVFAASSDAASLDSLYAGRRWTELYKAVQSRKDQIFFRGVLAAVFGDDAHAERLLRSVIASSPHSERPLPHHDGQHGSALGGLSEEAGREERTRGSGGIARPARSDRQQTELFRTAPPPTADFYSFGHRQHSRHIFLRYRCLAELDERIGREAAGTDGSGKPEH